MRVKSQLTSSFLAACVLFSASTLFVPQAFAADGPYSVVDHWKIGGEGGWDYLLADPSMHVLYITHGTQVEVVDTTTGKKVGAITGFKGTHGIALDTDGKVGFISGGAGNEVVAFDRKTYARIASIPTGQNPDGILFEPVTKTVWAFNGRSSDATVIDAASMKVTATIKLSGKPEFPVADGAGHVFVNIEAKNSVVSLDARKLAVTANGRSPAASRPPATPSTPRTTASSKFATAASWPSPTTRPASNSPRPKLATALTLPVSTPGIR